MTFAVHFWFPTSRSPSPRRSSLRPCSAMRQEQDPSSPRPPIPPPLGEEKSKRRPTTTLLPTPEPHPFLIYTKDNANQAHTHTDPHQDTCRPNPETMSLLRMLAVLGMSLSAQAETIGTMPNGRQHDPCAKIQCQPDHFCNEQPTSHHNSLQPIPRLHPKPAVEGKRTSERKKRNTVKRRVEFFFVLFDTTRS